jgi:hypothetical protein
MLFVFFLGHLPFILFWPSVPTLLATIPNFYLHLVGPKPTHVLFTFVFTAQQVVVALRRMSSIVQN